MPTPQNYATFDRTRLQLAVPNNYVTVLIPLRRSVGLSAIMRICLADIVFNHRMFSCPRHALLSALNWRNAPIVRVGDLAPPA